MPFSLREPPPPKPPKSKPKRVDLLADPAEAGRRMGAELARRVDEMASNAVAKQEAMPEAMPDDDEPAAPRVFRSEGHRQICACMLPSPRVGKMVGVSKQAVHMWRTGERVPSLEQRARLAQHLGIDPAAWERLPVDALPESTDDADDPDELEQDDDGDDDFADDVDALAEANEQIRYLRKAKARPGILARERSQIHADLHRAIKLKANLERERAMLEDVTVRNHPKWKQLRLAILTALRPYPVAARAVEQAIRDVLDESRANPG